MKLVDANCNANSFRMRHSSLGLPMVLTTNYYQVLVTIVATRRIRENTHATKHILWYRPRHHVVVELLLQQVIFLLLGLK